MDTMSPHVITTVIGRCSVFLIS